MTRSAFPLTAEPKDTDVTRRNCKNRGLATDTGAIGCHRAAKAVADAARAGREAELDGSQPGQRLEAAKAGGFSPCTF